MKISDRTLGYLSLFALVFIFAYVAMGMYEAHQTSVQTILVDFNELGTLQTEDPVVIRGYRVGSVGKVAWLGDRARIQIKFDEPVILREGTRIIDVNYALMGQRRVEIFPSKTGKEYPEDYIHSGIFEPGIAEVLRYIEDVNRQLSTVCEMIRLLSEGDSTHTSVAQTFENILSKVEGTLQSSDKLISTLQPTLNNLFSQVNTASGQLIQVTNQADTAIKTVTQAVNEKLSQAENVMKSISEGAAKTDSIITDLENDSTIHALLYSRDMVDKLTLLANKLDTMVHIIDPKDIKIIGDDGKTVQLITWKNINLIGETAREKARVRAAKGESLPE
mgnify:CR=1 FL=1